MDRIPWRRIARPALISLALVATTAVPAAVPPSVRAAGTTLYVDGKLGDDAHDGRSAAQPFKTIARAARAIPSGSGAAGWRVIVKGYSDYVYRERAIPPSWDRRGAAGSPVRFMASGYVAGSDAYVKPIVSGADSAPRPGESWTTTSRPGIWRTAWPVKPFGYGTYNGALRTALFQDRTTWLWEQSSWTDLEKRAKAGTGGYLWSAGYLYATAVGSPSAGTTSPAKHTIDVVMRHTFFFEGHFGVRQLEVRGFEVRHSANGIAFAQGVDDAVAADNRVIGNLPMGIGVSGRRTSTVRDPAARITLVRNVGAWNTLQAVKLDVGTQDARVCDNRFSDNGLQGIKVQGARDGDPDDLLTTSVVICANQLSGHDLNPSGSPYNNANGLTIANGARNVTVEGNRIEGNDVGIHITQETSGRVRMDGVVMRRNDIHHNRRFGIFFYDGAQGTTAGSGAIRSEYDVVWRNGIGVQVGRGSRSKVLVHLTAYDNLGDGVRIGESGLAAASGTVSDSLVTHNGGYGAQLVAGSTGVLKYTGSSSNTAGSARGSWTKTAVNTRAPGYRTTVTTSPDFLRLASSSYQLTAGYGGGYVGARR